MSDIEQVYEKYKHLDPLFVKLLYRETTAEDPPTFNDQMLYDFWQAVKSEGAETRKLIALYVTLRDYEQFTKPSVLQEISAVTGIKYEPGHLTRAIVRDMENLLLGIERKD